MKRSLFTTDTRRTQPLLLAALCLVLCCCTAEDRLASGDSTDGRLTFSVRADGYASTRGIPLNSLSGMAGLLGYAYDTEGGWGDGQAPEMMYNEVMQGSGSTWQTSRTYVPDTKKTMRFYAYYPYQPIVALTKDIHGNDSIPMITMSLQDESGIPYFDYLSPLTASEQEDLMFAVSSEVTTNSSNKLDKVELQFHHLLAALRLTFTNGFDNGFLKRVTISTIHHRGHFSYDTQSWTDIESDVEDISQELNVRVTTNDTQVKPLTGDTEYFFLLPQELEENSVLTLVYNNGVDDYTLTYPLGLAEVEVTDGNGHPVLDSNNEPVTRRLDFKAGKLTTLNISIESLTKMTVKFSVQDWQHGATFDGADSDQTHIDVGSNVDSWTPDQGLESNGDTIEHVIVTGPQS